MPGKSNTNVQISKKTLARIEKNKRAIEEAYFSDSAIYGRVTKRLGGNRIEVILHDQRTYQAQIRGILMKKCTPIMTDDIVILEDGDFTKKTYYVIGVLDRKQATLLSQESKIPRWFITKDLSTSEKISSVVEEDGLYDFDYEETGNIDDETVDKKNKINHRKSSTIIENDDNENIDIDNI